MNTLSITLRIIAGLCLATVFAYAQKPKRLYLDEIDLSEVQSGWKSPQPRKAVDNDSIIIGGKYFSRGIGTHATCLIELNLDGKVQSFQASVGIDDRVKSGIAEHPKASRVKFVVVGDGKVLFDSDTMAYGKPAKKVNVALTGVKSLYLLADELGDSHHDHVDWGDAFFMYSGNKPTLDLHKSEKAEILTPPIPDIPQYNGPLKVGASAGKPILFRIPVSGLRPIKFSVTELPSGLKLDENRGIITGTISKNGRYTLNITAENKVGKTNASVVFAIGERLLLTPPLGWNSWNGYGVNITGKEVLANAKAMHSSGLADFGYTYLNTDDGWQGKRDTDSTIIPNEKFGDMKALADSIHALGLKAGIYSSPGPLTCWKRIGSYKNEVHDAQTFAKWGFDYLKYDWCSYNKIKENPTLQEMKDPYILMGNALKAGPRDIAFSLCQYGMGNVSAWGNEVWGSVWRTTGDIIDSWGSMQTILTHQLGLEQYAKPGAWNDPDMMVVGVLGWGDAKHATRLTPNEQYFHVSRWAITAAPILLGCDLTKLDAFTKNLLMNREVNAINQDTLGVQGKCIINEEGKYKYVGRSVQVFVKPLADGGKAIGVFNLSSEAINYTLDLDKLGLKGPQQFRDVWRQKDMGLKNKRFPITLNRHGAQLYRVYPARMDGKRG